MKNLSVILSMLCLMTVKLSNAQSPVPVGGFQLNAGIGLSSWGIPVYLGLDYGVHKDITLGGEIGYRSYNEDWNNGNGNGKYHHNILGFSVNGNYHFNTLLKIPQNWDFYAGLNLGFFVWSSPDGYPGDHTSGVGLGAQVGGRYYFNDKIGIQLEVGGGSSYSGGKLGLSFKL